MTFYKITEYKGRNAKELWALAYSEVVAEMMEPVLTDTDAISRISQKIKQQDRSLWEKIKDFIKGIVEKLKAAYRDMEPDSAIARLTRQTVTNSEAVLDAFSEAAADAVLNYNLQDGQKNNAREGGLYSLRGQTQQELTKRYQQEVDQVLNAPYADSRQLVVGYTPSIYQELGMPSLPLTIGSGHVYSTAKTEAQARQDGNYKRGVHYHGLGDAAVKNIYNAIQDPVMIIAAKDVNKNASPMRSTHSVVAIVDIGTAGKSLLVPIEITAERKVNGIRMDVNTISSVYEKSVKNLVTEAIAQENSGDIGIFYAKKEALTLPGAGVQFPVQLQQSIASNSIVHRFSEKVNMKISENTQSQQFKRWFGDWQNDPKNASKVVNADGTPKVVYHGTNAEFTVFDLSKSGRNYGETSEGLFFFTNKRSGYQDSALDYAKAAARNGGEATVGEYYLDIKNPLRLYSDGYFTPTAYFDQNAQDIYEKYLSGNYDGIIIENRNKSADDSIIYMLDNPNQIKSATDNIGTFDGSNPDTLYSSRTASDSEYLNLAQNPEENREALSRMVENAAREAGYTRLFFHGSKKGGGFTVFRDWQYFTENREYAKRYANRENPGSLYETYVKMENPFDTRIPEVRELFEQARQEYGMGELQENGLPDWTDGYDIADYIDENDLPYDGIILDEGGDMVNGKPVSRGLSYVIRNSSQVKSADAVTYDDNGNVIPLSQRFDAGKEDIRYSARYAAAEENPEIADLVQRVLSGDFKANDKVYLGTVSSQNAARIQGITGINVDGFRVAIEARQIEHILNRHGVEGSADHSMAQVSDISKIGYILANPDNIAPAGKTQAYTYMRNGKNRTADTVIYEKGIGEKTYYAVQAVPDTKAKTLYIVTAFIQKNSKGASQLIGANGSDVNVRDGSVVTPTGNVAQTGTNVKGENLESRRVSQEIKDAIEEYRRQQDVQSKAYRQMYERQLEEVKKSYQKQISTMEAEYSANLTQIQDAFIQTVEASGIHQR